MSGLCGIVRFDGASVAEGDLERQMKALAHRGPDRTRTWARGPVGLGHLMMRITREDALDVQPLHEGNLSLVADVRLDNREELAEALAIASATLTGLSDSALLFAAYKNWGADCAEHLIGDFAFAAWDDESNTLTIARDHMGQRHIFYHRGDGFLAFASEVKGLWALPQVPRVLLEDRAADALLLDDLDDPGATTFEGIRGIPAGSIMTIVASGDMALRRYWEPHADPAHEGRDEAYYIATYRKVLAEAVACRLRRAIAPAGLLMGGGFDSSAICGLAGPVVTAQGRKFIAVSSVMPEDYRGTVRHARKWVEMCRHTMPHLDVRYVTREGLDIFNGMEKAFLATGNRHSPNGYITRAIFAEIAASGARIVMDGHGGDYTLNPRGQNFLVRLLRRGQLRRFASEFDAMRRHLRQSVKQTLVRNVILQCVPAPWMRAWTHRRSGLAPVGTTLPLSRNSIKNRDRNSRPRLRRKAGESQRAGMMRTLRRVQAAPAVGYSVPAAVHGLEFTQPFHDKRVVEFALAIPETLYVKNGKTRYLAREALKDLYPPEYQDRPPGNDDIAPDFLLMAKRIEPRVLAEIDRMEKAGYLARYFDFQRMRKMLTRRTVEQHRSGFEYDTQQAMLAFLAARYIEWFRGDNR